jgi:Predicted membrane protein
LNRYSEYNRAIPANPKLLHGLSANYLVDMKGRVESDPSALPRVFVPTAITWVPDAAAARATLASMDPAQGTVVEGPPNNVYQQQPAELRVVEYRENWYKVHYSAASDTVLRIAVPTSPGWTARVDGAETRILPADYAFSGVIIPAGQHDLTLEFRSRYVQAGGALSAATALGLIFLLLRRALPEKTPL